MGDWLLYGTAKWGERYGEAARITGYDIKSLRNIRYVSSRCDVSLRRDTLTWSHHALVAALVPEEQGQWLDRAVADKLSVEDLRIELRAGERGGYSAVKRQEESLEQATREGMVCPNCGFRVGTAETQVERSSG